MDVALINALINGISFFIISQEEVFIVSQICAVGFNCSGQNNNITYCSRHVKFALLLFEVFLFFSNFFADFLHFAVEAVHEAEHKDEHDYY